MCTDPSFKGYSKFDCVVLGGGPAGAAAARLLSLAGARTQILHFEQGRHRKGEILQGSYKRLLSALGISDGHRSTVAGSISFWGDEPNLSSAISTAGGPDLLTDRQSFDSSARDAACEAGAHLVPLTKLPVVTRSASGWEIEFGMGPRAAASSCPLLLDCTGRRAYVARRFGQRRRLDRLICRYHLATGDGLDRDERWILRPDASGWWFSVRVSANERVFCRFEDAPLVQSGGTWEFLTRTPELGDIAHRHGYRLVEHSNADASTCISSSLAPGLLAVGDAALSIDPLSGQGLGLALSQGVVAAAAALSHLEGTRRSLAEFRTLQEREAVRLVRERASAYSSTKPEWKFSPFWLSRQHADTWH